jgi:hypothetical protein
MRNSAAVVMIVIGLVLGISSVGHSDVNIPGMGSGAYDGPSVGGPGNKVDTAPICDNRSRPKITKVAPDPMKPGDKIVITGENFGTKECFHDVSIGALSSGAGRAEVKFKYVNETTVEATVPDLKPGLTPLNVVTSGGSSQSIVLIQAK